MSETNGNGGYTPSDKPRTGSLSEKINQLHAERRSAGPETTQYSEPVRHTANTPHTPVDSGADSGNDKKKKRGNRTLIWIIVALAAAVVLGVCAWLFIGGSQDKDASDTKEEVPAAEQELKETQLQLAQSEFENLDREFNELESQRQIIVEDSVKVRLTQEYESAKLQVEQLKKQLKDAANKSSAEIKALNDQIKTLRELIKHYLEEIDRLNKENEELRAQNQDLSTRLEQTSTNLAQTQREREHLAERMTLAEKLNVTGVAMNMLNKKDKNEKKIKNAKKFVISFTIPQNNSTPVGTKTIYAVITTPEGQLLDGAGTFAFEGGNVTASARRQVDYGGEEIGGVTMYYDIRNALTPGRYTVQLFCDGYALCNPQSFTFK